MKDTLLRMGRRRGGFFWAMMAAMAAAPGLACSFIYPVDHLSGGAPPAAPDSGEPPSDGSAFEAIRIACGNDAGVIDPQNNVWAKDAYYLGGEAYCSPPTQPVAGTDTPALYLCQRYGEGDSTFSYTFPQVPPGSYDVLLKFTENNATYATEREFNVDINGVQVLYHFDIFANCSAKDWVALDSTSCVTVTDSNGITIVFTDVATTGSAKVDAIAITPASRCP